MLLRFLSKFLKMDERKLMLISSSNLHQYEFLEYAFEDITDFLKRYQVDRILFIPYALPDYDKYFEKVNNTFSKLGFEVDSIHKHADPVKAVQTASAFFIGGGNTFRLLHNLYDKKLMEPIRQRVIVEGRPYIGSSAGTNVATLSINTTNDMPIMYPPSFAALQLVSFNINPHYMDPDLNTTHKGETREQRIMEYVHLTGRVVLGLREGAHLFVENGKATLKGINSARLFRQDQVPQELASGSDVSFLLQEKCNCQESERKEN